METTSDIKNYLTNLHTQQVTDLFGACRISLKEPENTLWTEMAIASIGEAKLGIRSSFEERYESGKNENINKWMDSACAEIQRRVC
jgi:hypothetical protein